MTHEFPGYFGLKGAPGQRFRILYAESSRTMLLVQVQTRVEPTAIWSDYAHMTPKMVQDWIVPEGE